MTGHAHDWWDGLWRCRCGAGPFPDFGGFAEHATGAYCDPGRLNESHYPVGIPERPKGPLPDALAEELRALVACARWHTSRPGYSYTLHWYVLSHEERHNRLYCLMYRAVWEHGEFSVFAWQPTRVLTLDAWRYWAYWYTPRARACSTGSTSCRGRSPARGWRQWTELTGRPLKRPADWDAMSPCLRQAYIRAQRDPQARAAGGARPGGAASGALRPAGGCGYRYRAAAGLGLATIHFLILSCTIEI